MYQPSSLQVSLFRFLKIIPPAAEFLARSHALAAVCASACEGGRRKCRSPRMPPARRRASARATRNSLRVWNFSGLPARETPAGSGSPARYGQPEDARPQCHEGPRISLVSATRCGLSPAMSPFPLSRRHIVPVWRSGALEGMSINGRRHCLPPLKGQAGWPHRTPFSLP